MTTCRCTLHPSKHHVLGCRLCADKHTQLARSAADPSLQRQSEGLGKSLTATPTNATRGASVNPSRTANPSGIQPSRERASRSGVTPLPPTPRAPASAGRS